MGKGVGHEEGGALLNFTSMVDLTAFTREDQNEAIESVLNTYAVRYGDDYAASGWVPRLLHRDLPRGARRGVGGNGTRHATGGGGRGAGARVRLHRLARPRHPAHGGDRELATCLRRRHPIRPALRPGSPTSVQRRTRWRLASPTCSCTWAATSQGDPRNGHYYPGSVWLRGTLV